MQLQQRGRAAGTNSVPDEGRHDQQQKQKEDEGAGQEPEQEQEDDSDEPAVLGRRHLREARAALAREVWLRKRKKVPEPVGLSVGGAVAIGAGAAAGGGREGSRSRGECDGCDEMGLGAWFGTQRHGGYWFENEAYGLDDGLSFLPMLFTEFTDGVLEAGRVVGGDERRGVGGRSRILQAPDAFSSSSSSSTPAPPVTTAAVVAAAQSAVLGDAPNDGGHGWSWQEAEVGFDDDDSDEEFYDEEELEMFPALCRQSSRQPRWPADEHTPLLNEHARSVDGVSESRPEGQERTAPSREATTPGHDGHERDDEISVGCKDGVCCWLKALCR